MIQTLVCHGLLSKLRIRLVRVRDERHPARGQHPDAVDLAPFREMARHHLLDIIGHMDPANIQRAVLARERAHTAHVVPVIAELVPTETVHVGVEEVMQRRQAVEVFALVAFGADAAREEQAEVRSGHLVCACVPAVLGDVAPGGRGVFREILVLAVAAGPLVVPDVEDGACLRGRLRFKRCRVHLRPSGSSFSPDYLLGLFLCAIGVCGGRDGAF